MLPLSVYIMNELHLASICSECLTTSVCITMSKHQIWDAEPCTDQMQVPVWINPSFLQLSCSMVWSMLQTEEIPSTARNPAVIPISTVFLPIFLPVQNSGQCLSCCIVCLPLHLPQFTKHVAPPYKWCTRIFLKSNEFGWEAETANWNDLYYMYFMAFLDHK